MTLVVRKLSRIRTGSVACLDNALREPKMMRTRRCTRVDATQQPRALFICGSLNQTTQLQAVAAQLPEFESFFTPLYGGHWVAAARRWGWLESTILGNKLRARCVTYLKQAGLAIDLDARRQPYDLVVACTDLFVPNNVRGCPLVIVQEGMTDPETIFSRIAMQISWWPAWSVGTTLTGTRGAYDRFCVASPGYRELFIARGAPSAKLYVTGIPNFDDCQRYRNNKLPERDYVLACTSDLRETLRRDDRVAFLRRVLRVAAGRRVHFKFHPNEDWVRAESEARSIIPSARIHAHERTEELIANCDVLVTQFSSVAFVGLALGKEVHSYCDVAELRRMLPLQNGGQSAANIAGVCRELLGLPVSEAMQSNLHHAETPPCAS